MKYFIFWLMAFYLWVNMGYAQKWYVRFAPGYAVPFSKESSSIREFTQIRRIQSDSIAPSFDKANFTTLGGGLMLNAAVGYKVSHSVLFELEAQYLYGNAVQGKGKIILDPEDFNKPEVKGTLNVDVRRYSRQVRLIPSVTLRTPEFYGILVPYIKTGLVLPAGGKSITDVIQKFSIPTEMQKPPLSLQNDSTLTLRYETKGRFGVGWHNALGVMVKTGNKVALFAEVFHQSFLIRPAYTQLVKYEENGKDRLSTKTEYEKRIEYVDEINESSNNALYNPSAFINSATNEYDKTQPGYQKAKQELSIVSNFNNLGLNFGVRVYLK